MTNEEFKSTLWNSANILRGSVAAAEYKYPVLALVFLKYVSDMFKAQAKVIEHRIAEPDSPIAASASASEHHGAAPRSGPPAHPAGSTQTTGASSRHTAAARSHPASPQSDCRVQPPQAKSSAQ